MPQARALVIGCGNLLRGDDAAGPTLVHRLGHRGLPNGVRCIDGGTGGMDVVERMRRVPEVILVDACLTGAEPGTIFELPGDELATLPPPARIDPHAFRWDHALAVAHRLLGAGHPGRVTAVLIEGATFALGASLSPAVDRAIDVVAEALRARFGAAAAGGAPCA